MFSSIVSVLVLIATVSAKTIMIDVGEDGIVFSPNSTIANMGDMLEFHFYLGSGPHSVVTGVFDAPCTPTNDGFFSNYMTGTSSGNETYTIPVTSTDPIWYYCSARMHCQGGMVGVVNPPSNETIADYAAAAQSAVSNVAPASTQIGGTVATIPASSMTVSSSMTSSSSMNGSSSMTGTSSMVTGTGVAATGSTTSPSGTATSTSTGGGVRQTFAAVGLMAAGGFAALIV